MCGGTDLTIVNTLICTNSIDNLKIKSVLYYGNCLEALLMLPVYIMPYTCHLIDMFTCLSITSSAS